MEPRPEKIQKLLRLKAEIGRETKELDKLESELKAFLENVEGKEPSSLELRALGSILHDFYTGVERIFERIARELNGGVPEGIDWHRQLLRDMTLEIEGVRPPVIDEEMEKKLDEYLRFRHLFRNIYGFSLEWRFLEGLAVGLDKVWDGLKQSLKEFSGFLTQLAEA